MSAAWWSEGEREYLLRHWTDSVANIAAHLGRTIHAVNMQVSYLRRRGYIIPTHNRPDMWTPAQEEALRCYWDLEPRFNTAVRVGHTVGACEQRAYILFGSEMRERWDEEEREGREEREVA